MSVQKKEKSLLDRLRYKYRMVLLNDDTLEERLSFRLSRLNIYLFLSTLFTVMLVGIVALIVFTPLKEYIPGYGDTNMRRHVLNLTETTDSLKKIIDHQASYIANIKGILTDDLESLETSATANNVSDDSDTSGLPVSMTQDVQLDSISKEELELRTAIEQKENYQLFHQEKTKEVTNDIADTYFFAPINGYITSKFDYDSEHFGIDIVASENEPIKAIADGIVMMASWTLETGHVIAVQHENNLVSFYKHNSVLLKKVGNFVKAGDVIAIIGSSGEKTTGPHLHFELWHNQKPLNPIEYIAFN